LQFLRLRLSLFRFEPQPARNRRRLHCVMIG
jgi:hypothetical protein